MKKISSNKRFLVLGASGFLGSRVFALLREQSASVTGTTHSGSDDRFLTLDVSDARAVEQFSWSSYDAVIDCTGYIGYEQSLESEARNREQNLEAPMRICSRLTEAQSYLYCSTHAVLVPEETQNPYSRSKRAFEQYAISRSAGPIITLARIPGLFHESRESGLLHRIKSAFRERTSVRIDGVPPVWHAMYLPRAAAAIVVAADIAPAGLCTVGYPCATDPHTIIAAAEEAFGYEVSVSGKDIPNTYVPDVSPLVALHEGDFTTDLKTYFVAP